MTYMYFSAKWLVGPAMVLGVMGLAVPPLFCNATLHVPSRDSGIPEAVFNATRGAAWSDAELRARDGVRLEGSFVRAQSGSEACVMVLHGIGDSRRGTAGFAPMLVGAGYSVLLPDSRGHGKSGGDLVTYGLVEKFDVLDWAGWMQTHGCRRIYGLGESLGGAVLIQAAGIAPVFRAVVAECSFASLEEIGLYRVRQMVPLPDAVAEPAAKAILWSSFRYARWSYGLDFTEASPVASIARAKTPILLIHGLADTRTPPVHSKELARANANAVLWLVPRADHTAASSTEPEEFRGRVKGWFENH